MNIKYLAKFLTDKLEDENLLSKNEKLEIIQEVIEEILKEYQELTLDKKGKIE